MAAAQTAEQKAAAEKVAAEKQAAEQKAAEEKAAAEAAQSADTDTSESKPKGPRFVVAGAVAVIRTSDGSERYLYRGAPVDPDAFDAESIKHVTAVGLIAEV